MFAGQPISGDIVDGERAPDRNKGKALLRWADDKGERVPKAHLGNDCGNKRSRVVGVGGVAEYGSPRADFLARGGIKFRGPNPVLGM